MFAAETRLPPTRAELAIRRRIADDGAITFAEFMRLALYHPDGYYSRRRRIGADGDYFTSPVAHPAFGALIAVQLRVMWQTLGHPARFWVVELGAGDGLLARDISRFCSRWPDFLRALRYAVIDRVPPPAYHRRAGISSPRNLSWIAADSIPATGIVGCILSNELIDAMPVHRFRIVDGEAREIYVSTASGDGCDDNYGSVFYETLGELSTRELRKSLERLPRNLPDGFEGEVNIGISAWADTVGASLERGYVLTIDYGGESEELYSSRFPRGTLQTHYRHTAGGSPYHRIGRQDLTARVDFSALIEDGRRAGLRPVFLTTQAEFLMSLGFGRMEESMQASIRPLDVDARTKAAYLRSLRRLAQPDGLGGFRVLLQDKDSGIRASSELSPSPSIIAALDCPLPGPEHLPEL